MDDPTNDRPGKRKEAKTTIVGGRPPERDRQGPEIPRGIEVLLKKASVDAAFRKTLFEKRAGAAGEIGIELTPAESAMLDTIPEAQLAGIVDSTRVPDAQRPAFLGQVGADMLAALASERADDDRGEEQQARLKPRGHLTRGVRPQIGPPKGLVTEQAVEQLVVREIRAHSAPGEQDCLLIRVGYDCPFGAGRISINLYESEGVQGATLEYGPAQSIAVSRRSGQVIFRVCGTGGTTNWVILQLRSTVGQCRYATRSWPRRVYEPGEFLVEECVIWRMVEYHHVWPAEA